LPRVVNIAKLDLSSLTATGVLGDTSEHVHCVVIEQDIIALKLDLFLQRKHLLLSLLSDGLALMFFEIDVIARDEVKLVGHTAKVPVDSDVHQVERHEQSKHALTGRDETDVRQASKVVAVVVGGWKGKDVALADEEDAFDKRREDHHVQEHPARADAVAAEPKLLLEEHSEQGDGNRDQHSDVKAVL
jgi:hypothetical protein